MLTERRGQQNLALTTGITTARCSGRKGQIDSSSQEELFRNRWVRISLLTGINK